MINSDSEMTLLANKFPCLDNKKEVSLGSNDDSDGNMISSKS